MNKNINIDYSYKLIVFSMTYGLSFYYLKTFSKQNSWLIVIIANIIGILFMKMILEIKNTYKNKNIYDINKMVLGNIIGNIVNVIFTIIFILISITISWYLFIFLRTVFLNKTPVYIIAFATSLPLFYAINKDNSVIIKANTIFAFIVLLLTIISIFFLIPQAEIDNLKPFIEINNIDMINALFGFFTSAFLPTYALVGLNDLNFKNIKICFIKNILMTLSIVLITYMVLGTSIINIVDFPQFFVLRKIGLLANGTRIDSLIIIGWLISIYSLNIISLFFIRNFLRNKIKSYKNYYSYILITIIIFLATHIFKNVAIGKVFILKFLPTILFASIFFINFIIFIKIKKKPKSVSHYNNKYN